MSEYYGRKTNTKYTMKGGVIMKKPYLYEEKSREELVQLIEDKNLIISALCEKLRKEK